jgi:histidine triad (HIT) family protein
MSLESLARLLPRQPQPAQTHAMAYDPSNLFAKIIAGEIPSHKIFETPHAVAILDAFPLVEGHALLLPKHPCVDVTDMPPDVAASVLKELPRLARLVQQATGADGVNIVQNSGKAAGQVVFHCHFHVIPRFDSDQKPIAFGASRKSMISGDEAASVLSRMKEPYAGSLSAIEELMGEMRAGSVTKPAAAAASKPAAAKPAAKQEAKPAKQESKEKPAAAKPAKQEAKEAKDKPAKEAAPPKKAAPAADRPLDISYADIRVGKIIDAKPHPDSDKLFVETIELGEPAPQLVASASYPA